jgi:hypothetical protein
VKGEKNDIPTKWNPKSNRLVIFISGDIRIKPKLVTKCKERHNILIKGTIQKRRCNDFEYICTSTPLS